MVVASRVLRAFADVVALSVACLTLATCGGGGGDGGTGTGAPAIALSEQTIDFAGLVGGANPSVKTVAVTNSGGGGLGGLTSGITYGASEPTGWLTASLNHSSAPSTLTLSSATGVLGAGVYTASVEIASSVASNSPRHVDVTFTITTSIPTTPPAAPTGLAATAPSSSQINLSWTDNATNESGFQIQRCAGVSCTGFADYALVGPNVKVYADGSLPASTTYRYRVRAYNDIGTSAYSGIATGTTQAPAVVVPTAPTALTATAVSSTQINLSWTDNSTNETGFRLEGCAGQSCTSFNEFATVVANVTTYSVTSLTNSTDYVFRIRAYNDAGNSTYSNTATAFTPQDPPEAPSGLIATAASSSQINLSWTDNSSIETGFRIDRCAGASCTNFTELAIVAANVTTYQNTSLPASTAYSYRVRAYNGGGNSGYTNSASATTLSATISPPAAPTSLTATAASSSQINLAWTDNASDETGFRIERCAGLSCVDFVEITTVGANVTTYQNTSLASETGYNYRVRAYNTGGNSGYSNSQSATTLATAPAAPTVLTATATSSSQINLSWTDNASNETGFLIERCTGSGCVNFVEFASTTTNVTTYQNTGLAASTVYTYRVRAWNATGTSGYSNSAPATTLAPAIAPPAAPTNMTANVISTSVIDLSWTDNATTETGFSVEGCTGAACTNFAEIGTFGPNVTLINANGLAQGTSYRFRVRAYNTGGYSAYSNIVTATTHSATTFLVQYDNLVAKSSADPTVQTKVYQSAENAVGWDYYYTGGSFTNYLATASLMKFDVQSTIAGKTIVEAKLLFVERDTPGDLNGTFKIAALAQAWNPATMTWNVFDSPAVTWYTANTVDFGASSTQTVSAREFNITAMVQLWANGTWVNNGIVLYDDAPSLPPFASYQHMSFHSLDVYGNTSQRPQLYIRYR